MNKKEESILNSATALFSQYGYHAVGVDLIIADSNVAKMTFYKYFPSKNILIEKVLIRRDETLRESIGRETLKARTPIDKIKAIFDWHCNWFNSPNFYGCMYIKARAEFPEETSEVKLISLHHKEWLASLISSSLSAEKVKSPKQLAWNIMIILEGLTVTSMMRRPSAQETTRTWRLIMLLIESNRR